MPQRPDKFTIDPHNHLANGLVFAGLGANAGSTLYQDSSLYGDHGTLNGTWICDSPTSGVSLRSASSNQVRWGIGNNTHTGSVSCWMVPKSVAGTNYLCAYGWEGLGNVRIAFGTTGDKLYINAYHTGGIFSSTCTGTLSLTANTLVHAVWVSDGSQYSIYKDGKHDVTSGDGSWLADAPTPFPYFYLGRYGATVYEDVDFYDVLQYDRALSYSEIQQLADPSNVMLSGLIRPPMRRWWPVVSGGGGGVTIDCTLGAVTIAGQNLSISVGTTINCTVGAIAIADYACDISVGATINCTLGAVAIAGQNTTIIAGTTIDCTSGALAITGHACSIAAGTTITCTTGAVTVAGNACSISTGTTIACTSGVVTVVGNAAEVTQTTQINCTLGAIVLAALAVDIQATTTVNCTLASLAISGHDVTISLTGNVVPDGVDYRVTDLRPHYSVTDSRPHYRAEDTRPHYRA